MDPRNKSHNRGDRQRNSGDGIKERTRHVTIRELEDIHTDRSGTSEDSRGDPECVLSWVKFQRHQVSLKSGCIW